MENFKKLSRDQMKKISGGYVACGQPCYDDFNDLTLGCDPSAGGCMYCYSDVLEFNTDGRKGYCSTSEG